MPIKHPLSLSSNDFYPLIHISTGKKMSYDEKIAYRATHSVPSTIDQWIANEKMNTEAPTADPYRRGPSLKYLLWRDDVECTLNVMHKEVGIC
jgi:hypothetical protein